MGYPLGGLEDRNKSAQGQPRGADEQTIWPAVAYHDCYIDSPNSRAISRACWGMCCSTCLGITHIWREPPVETGAVTAAPAVSQPASGDADEGATALATAQAEAKAEAAG